VSKILDCEILKFQVKKYALIERSHILYIIFSLILKKRLIPGTFMLYHIRPKKT